VEEERRPRLELIAGGAVARPALGPALELMALGTGLTLTAVLLGRLPSWRAELGSFQALFAVAFAFYGLAVWRSAREAPPIATAIVLVVALAARVALLPVTPSLSDDIYRYIWEGQVVATGGDPYRSAPLVEALAHRHDDALLRRINHPELASVYPPAALAGFALVSRISPTVWAMKLWVVLHDLVLVWLLVKWVRGRGEDAPVAIAYAWNPLVLVEYAGSGHHDPTAMVWLVAALMYAQRRPMGSALALSVAVLTKLVPVFALPFVWRSWNARARLAALVLIGAGLGFFALATRSPDSGLAAYARTWANNELLFHYLAAWTGDPLRARWLAAGLMAVLVVSLAWRRIPAPFATRAALRAGLIVSPVVHPWYLGWALVFEPFARSPGWLLLSLTCVLSYGVFAPPAEGGAFHLPLSWRWVEYGLPLALAATLAWRRRRHRDRARRRP
jgi:alpha-1,6-mannosyltransferase